ncbi:hypothetical protein GGC47_003182 [Bosea sp. OAE752]|uniref:hypothetical protein n=1 Tax=Bosea sp. OAE752 TaxID=2663873 RepID=UPI003D2146AB
MIEPRFSDGLPPDGAEGLFLACDSAGGLWLLRWEPTRSAFAALGWPSAGHPEQRPVRDYAGWLITGHQAIAWTPPAAPEDASWAEVDHDGPAALPAPAA